MTSLFIFIKIKKKKENSHTRMRILSPILLCILLLIDLIIKSKEVNKC